MIVDSIYAYLAAVNSLEVGFADGEQVLFSQVFQTDDYIARVATAQCVLVLVHICGKSGWKGRDGQ